MAEDQGHELTEAEAKQARAELSQEIFGDEDTAVEKTPGTVEESEVTGKEPEKEPDPWEGVNPVVREQFEAMSKQVSTLNDVTARLKQAEQRIGAMTNEAAKAKKDAEALSDKAAPTEEEIEAAAEDEDEWEALKEEFPVWAKAVDNRIKKESKTTKDIIDKISSLEKKVESSGSEGVDYLKQEIIELKVLAIAQKYPDWQKIKETPEFQQFRDSDPENQRLASSLNPKDAISLLDKFTAKHPKKEKTAAEIAAERKRRLSESQTPESGRLQRIRKSEEDMTDAEIRAREAKKIFASG